jgi:hypothetical protein
MAYLLLLGILAATVTYQAGLNPPGCFWEDSVDGHIAGDPILETIYLRRYKAFFYCNATAFVASLVIITLLQSQLITVGAMKRHILQTGHDTGSIWSYGGLYCWKQQKVLNILVCVWLGPSCFHLYCTSCFAICGC